MSRNRPSQQAAEDTLSWLIAERNRLNADIDKRTAEAENVPGAVSLIKRFLNWHGWYEREGFDDESRQELEEIVHEANLLVSSLETTGK